MRVVSLVSYSVVITAAYNNDIRDEKVLCMSEEPA